MGDRGKADARTGQWFNPSERKEIGEMTDGSERRRNARVNIRWPITVETPRGTVEGETANISTSGAYVQCPLTVQSGETVTLTISPHDHPPIKIIAEVIWVAAAPSAGMGVFFSEISNADSSYLDNVVKRATE